MDKFFQGWLLNFELPLKLEDVRSSPRMLNHARRFSITHLVSLIEAYLKDVIIVNAGKWDKAGVDELLKESIPLNDAFQLFKERKLKKENLIAHSKGFQNLESIDKVFSALLGKPFIKSLKALKSDHPLFAMSKSDIAEELTQMFMLRHKIVHECFTGKISSNQNDVLHTAAFKLAQSFVHL
jgi:hypothetical protein